MGIYTNEPVGGPHGVYSPDANNPMIIGPAIRVIRKIEDSALKIAFPFERVLTDFDGLSEDPKSKENFAELQRLVGDEGYAALLVGAHFSRTDPIVGILASAKDGILRRRRYVVAIAKHQLYPGLRIVGNLAGVELWPLVTEHTVKKAVEKSQKKRRFRFFNPTIPEEGEGKREFMRRAMDAFANGGAVYIAPQGEREDKLRVPDKNAAGTLLFGAFKHGLTKIAILTVGYEIEGVEDYKAVSEFNFRRKCLARFGRVCKLMDAAAELGHDPEALKKAREFGRVMNLIDAWLAKRIAEVSPAAYVAEELKPLPV